MAERVRSRQAAYAAVAFAGLVLVGTVGFALITGESLFDAFYRTIITVYTAGLVAAPVGVGAKLFTIFLVVWGVAVFFFAFGILIDLVVSGAVSGRWLERRRRKQIEGLSGHYIICGYGRVGQRIAAEFREAGARHVVLDYGEDALAAAREYGDLLVVGDGTQDRYLQEAGIERASGLVVSSDSDADNVSITLSARAARDDILIVARATSEEAARKLRLAGANRVVQPYSTAGREMATLVLKPQVAAFLDAVSPIGGPDLLFEEIEVTESWPATGRSIGELRIRGRTGALVVALRRADGQFETTPPPGARLESGDVMVAVGTPDELRALEELVASPESVAR